MDDVKTDGAPVMDMPVTGEQVPAQENPTGQFFTQEDLVRARAQEKDKLYPQMEKMRDELANLKREKDEREAEEARRRAEAEADLRKKAEEEMDVRSLLEKKEAELTAQLEAERLEREKAFALLEQERKYQELMTYRSQRLEQERDNIIPELIDLIDGGSPDEIEASINSLKDRSSRIIDSAQSAMSNARREMAGTRLTNPAAGPLDNDPENRPVTPDDVRNMSLADYAKNRNRLLGGGASSGGRGLFG